MFKYLIALFLVLFTASYGNAAVYVYNSGDASELASRILSTRPPNSNYNYVLYQIDLGPDILPGDILSVMAEAEFTNNEIYTVSVVTKITLSDSPSTFPSSVMSGEEITEANGPNVDPNIVHHSVHTKVGTIVIPTQEHRYVKFWVRAVTDSAYYRSGDYILAGYDYGRLAVIRFSDL